MKSWKRDNYTIILLEDNRCKCLYAIDENKNLCAWLDFDGFSYKQAMIISGLYIIEEYKNKGLLQILITVLEEVYLKLYDGYTIEVMVFNPKIKTMIKRLKRMLRFNNAEWRLSEKNITPAETYMGHLLFWGFTRKKQEFLQEKLASIIDTNKANVNEKIFEEGTQVVKLYAQSYDSEDKNRVSKAAKLASSFLDKYDTNNYSSEVDKFFVQTIKLLQIEYLVYEMEKTVGKLGKDSDIDSKKAKIQALFLHIKDMFGISISSDIVHV